MFCENIDACCEYYSGVTLNKPTCTGSICSTCAHTGKCKQSDHNTITRGYAVMCACNGWEAK
jgi:hypothetical protein